MSNRRVLVCDDDNMVLRSILRLLTHAGYEADGCTTRAEARRRLSATPYQAVVIDRGFPDGDGLEICRELRARRDHTPVLFVSAHGEDEDIVEGLEAGADDYIVKPIAWPVLRARMAAVLRRSSPPGTITAGAFTIDPLRHLATVRFPDEEPLEVSLSGVELRLLACRARSSGRGDLGARSGRERQRARRGGAASSSEARPVRPLSRRRPRPRVRAPCLARACARDVLTNRRSIRRRLSFALRLGSVAVPRTRRERWRRLVRTSGST